MLPITNGHFSVLPFSEENPDVEIIHFLKDQGMNFFTTYIDALTNGTEKDKYYYKQYAKYYLSSDMIYPELITMDDYLNALEDNKDILCLIDFLDNENDKLRCIKYILKGYKETDIDKIILHDNIIPFVDSTIFTSLISAKRLRIKPFIRSKRTRHMMFEWLLQYHKENLRFKSLVSVNVLDIYTIDSKFKEFINITDQLITIFKIGVTDDKIRAMRVPSDDISFFNKYFFLLHDFIDLSILNLISFKKFLSQSIDDWGKTLSRLENDENDPSAATDPTTDYLRVKISFFTSLYDRLVEIRYKETDYMDFYRYETVTWLSSLPDNTTHEILDTILGNAIEYLSTPRIVNYFDEKFFKLCMRILDEERNMTRSTSIRIKTYIIIASHFDTLETNVKRLILNNLNSFVNKSVVLFNELTTHDDYQIYIYQSEILRTLSPYKQYIFDVVSKDNIQKFMYRFLENYHAFYKGFVSNIKTIFKIKNDIEVTDEERQLGLDYEELLPTCEWYQNEIFCMDEYLLVDSFLDNTLGVGNRDRLALLLGYKLESFVGKDRKQLLIHEPKRYFAPLTHLNTTYHIFDKLQSNESFKKALVNETRFLKPEYIEKMLNILIKKNQILIREKESIQSNLVDSVKTGRDALMNDHDDEEIPDDLLDPIMGTLIETPVLLPNSETFMEKDVILRHLLNSEDNPFTRDPLTLADLEAYNKRDDIQERVSLFKQRLVNKR